MINSKNHPLKGWFLLFILLCSIIRYGEAKIYRKVKFNKFIVIIFFLTLGIFLSYASSEAVGIIRVTPVKIRLITPAGSSKTGQIDVENPTEQTKYIKAYLEDWYYLPASDGSKDFKPAGTTDLSCAKWISFVPAEFDLPPYGRQTINYTVNIPPDASGGHYAILFIENSPPKGSEDAGIGLTIRVGSLFYIEPEGTIQRTAELGNLRLGRTPDRKKLNIKIDFKNTGNTDITCGGNFNIIDKRGMVVARGEFEPVYTFGGQDAALSGAWTSTIPKGKYDLVLTFDLGKALEETNTGRGPVILKEAEIEIGDYGDILKAGQLK